MPSGQRIGKSGAVCRHSSSADAEDCRSRGVRESSRSKDSHSLAPTESCSLLPSWPAAFRSSSAKSSPVRQADKLIMFNKAKDLGPSINAQWMNQRLKGRNRNEEDTAFCRRCILIVCWLRPCGRSTGGERRALVEPYANCRPTWKQEV